MLRSEGDAGTLFKLRWLMLGRNNYSEWVKRYDSLDAEKSQSIIKEIQKMSHHPKISIILPVYNPPLELLDQAIQSVRDQLYPNWELCIADDASKSKAVIELLRQHETQDPRIRLILRAENGHISRASNTALSIATGEFVALLDHDDLLPAHALFWVAKAIINHPTAGLIYSDEDKIDRQGKRFSPYFKPDWNQDLFLSHNMIAHLGVYRTTLVRKVNGWRAGFEGAQDYDLALRCVEELKAEDIIHIPRVLYHWRVHKASTSASIDVKSYAIKNGELALNEHLRRRGIAGRAEFVGHGYKVHYFLPETPPLVTLIIPTRNGLQLLRQCVESILQKTNYLNYEILIVDNGSDESETLEYLKELDTHDNINIMKDARPFNYSALNNAAVKVAKGDLIALINNDIEVISPNWLSEMVGLALQPEVGGVGARLLYGDNRLQHGGIVLGIKGVAAHAHKYFPNRHHGYCKRMSLISSFSAVTAACLLIRKKIYNEVGGLNESDLKIAFNDVDFCLKVREAGYRNVWTPFAELYHHESATRGIEDTAEKRARFSQEVQYMQKRWGDKLLTDPAYNPNLTLEAEDFSFAWPPRL